MDEAIVFKYFPWMEAPQRERIAALGPLYREWNRKINVISRKDTEALYLHHILHSLALVRFIKDNGLAPGSILDAGTGGGFPGIPMAIAMPECRFILCDSIAKKTLVAAEIAKAIDLANVTTVWSRTEDLDKGYRCDFVVSRGVTALGKFIPMVRHLYTRGVLCLKGGDLEQEIDGCLDTCRIDKASIKQQPLSGYFEEDFFETKKIICIFTQKH